MYQILWRMYQGSKKAFWSGDRPQITLLWVFKWNYGQSMFRWGSQKMIGSDIPNFVKDVPRSERAFWGGDRPPITSLWVSKWNYGHPCSDGGPESDRIGCTKFNEWCTKGSKVRFKVGICSQSLSYGFLNEIMDHPCSDRGPRSDMMGCTKF